MFEESLFEENLQEENLFESPFFLSFFFMHPFGVVEQVVHDNWLAYKLRNQADRRRALVAAIVLAHPTFDPDVVLKRVEVETNDFPRKYKKKDEEVNAIVKERKEARGRRKKALPKVLFKIDEREFEDQEINDWVQDTRRKRVLPSSSKPDSVCSFSLWRIAL